jgi:RHS repeat-associated protein
LTVGSAVTKYLWDSDNPLPQLALERDGAGSLIRRYIHGNNLISFATPTAAFYYHYDGIGSVVNITNASGVKQWTYSYEPYGSSRTATSVTGAPANPVRFTAEYLDSDTGLYDLRARQYDPAGGRFLSTDPLAPSVIDPYVGSYIYSNDRPTVLTDPSGERAEGCGGPGCEEQTGDANSSVETRAKVESAKAVNSTVSDLKARGRRLSARTFELRGGMRAALDSVKDLLNEHYQGGQGTYSQKPLESGGGVAITYRLPDGTRITIRATGTSGQPAVEIRNVRSPDAALRRGYLFHFVR